MPADLSSLWFDVEITITGCCDFGHRRMEDARMGSEDSRLATLLDEAIGLLDGEGESHWRGVLARVLQQVVSRDPRGLDRLLQAYGGMGSFNDLTLRDPTADRELARLRSAIYDEARELAREVRRGEQPERRR